MISQASRNRPAERAMMTKSMDDTSRPKKKVSFRTVRGLFRAGQ